jgi:SHS2 domain-containing protein
MKVEADSQAELFRGALVGMSTLIRENFCAQNRASEISNTIVVHSQDITSLLIDFLNETLSLSHINKAVYCVVDILALSATDLSAIIEGYYSDEWEEDIKAVTYHEADVKVKNGTWGAHVIFDI